MCQCLDDFGSWLNCEKYYEEKIFFEVNNGTVCYVVAVRWCCQVSHCTVLACPDMAGWSSNDCYCRRWKTLRLEAAMTTTTVATTTQATSTIPRKRWCTARRNSAFQLKSPLPLLHSLVYRKRDVLLFHHVYHLCYAKNNRSKCTNKQSFWQNNRM